MTRTKLLSNSPTRAPLTVLAILLLLCATAVSGTARAQFGTETFPCAQGLDLPVDLAELDLVDLQAALQALVTEDPDATVTLLFEEEESLPIRADLLLADEAVLTALLEDQGVNVTLGFPEEEGPAVIVAIEVSTAEDCAEKDCVSIELPAALAGLDVAGLRAGLEEMLAENADATVTITGEQYLIGWSFIRADLLLGLEDPVLQALVVRGPLVVTVVGRDQPFEILGITLPEEGEVCQGITRPPEPGDIQDDQQGGDVQDDQRTGGGRAMATKTFRLTLNGTVPEGQVFGVIYGTSDDPEAFNQIIFCGQTRADPDTQPQEPDCRGGGTVYEERVTLAKDTGIIFSYFRSTEDVSDDPTDFVFEQFHTGEEVLQGNLVNSAWYTFGSADDDQQDTAAGEDTLDDQQGTGAGDTQDDQQAEVPAAMPSTGAGGMGGGTAAVVGTLATVLPLVVPVIYGALEHRR